MKEFIAYLKKKAKKKKNSLQMLGQTTVILKVVSTHFLPKNNTLSLINYVINIEYFWNLFLDYSNL